MCLKLNQQTFSSEKQNTALCLLFTCSEPISASGICHCRWIQVCVWLTLAYFSASSLTSFGTSSCRPFVTEGVRWQKESGVVMATAASAGKCQDPPGKTNYYKNFCQNQTSSCVNGDEASSHLFFLLRLITFQKQTLLWHLSDSCIIVCTVHRSKLTEVS